jgi:DNA-binding NtrC family response regulator
VLEAADGEAALALVGKDTPAVDLVVTDLSMPRLGGLEVLGALREHRPELPVVIVSAYAPSPQVRHLLEQFDVPILYKPFTPQVLSDTVRSALEHARGTRARSATVRQQASVARQRSTDLHDASSLLIATGRALLAQAPQWGGDL